MSSGSKLLSVVLVVAAVAATTLLWPRAADPTRDRASTSGNESNKASERAHAQAGPAELSDPTAGSLGRTTDSPPKAVTRDYTKRENLLADIGRILSNGSPDEKFQLAILLGDCAFQVSMEHFENVECEAVYADRSILAYEEQLRKDAIEAGHPVAVALDAYEKLRSNLNDTESLARLTDAVQSGDPVVLESVAGIRAVSAAGDFDAVEYVAWMEAARRYGANVDNTEAIRTACAYEGCDPNLDQLQYLQFAELTPRESVEAHHLYQAIVTAIESGDFSNIQLLPRH